MGKTLTEKLIAAHLVSGSMEPGLYDVNGRQVRCWKYAPEGGQDDVRG